MTRLLKTGSVGGGGEWKGRERRKGDADRVNMVEVHHI
jgi:hypothetical protein